MRAVLKRLSVPIAYVGALTFIVGVAMLLINDQLDTVTEILLMTGTVLVALYVLLNPKIVRRAYMGRTIRYGSNTVVMSLAFMGILAFINALGSRHHRRLDLTGMQAFSLSPQTIQILGRLEEPIQITGFFTGTDRRLGDVENLLREYAHHSDKIHYEFIDPDLKPARAREFGVTNYGTLVFQSGDHRQDILGTDESDITGAILKVSRQQRQVIYFLDGHQERGIDDFSQFGLGQMKSALENDNYQVETLSLAITDTVPSDATVIVVASPRKALLDEEIARIASWLEGGGKALFMADPGRETGLNDLIQPYGLRLRNDAVVDPGSSLLGDVASPAIVQYRFSQITRDLPMTFFPTVRSIEQLDPKPEGVTMTPLAATSERSWGETDLQGGQVRFDPDQDVQGPLYLAVSAQKSSVVSNSVQPQSRSRIVVFGDSDFASNAFAGSLGNRDLFLNAVNWLAEEEELISIRPPIRQPRQLFLTGPQARLIQYTTMIFLPLAVLFVGGVVWWNRR